MMREEKCHECGRARDEAPLIKCPMCHRFACEQHRARRGGKVFCSKRCAEQFFYGDDPDADPSDFG